MNTLNIYSAFDLLARGRTIDERKKLHALIRDKQANIADDQKITRQQVESWIRQSDLKRVSGMSDDMAYLLTIIGLRGTYDLAQIDAEKTADVLLSVRSSQLDDFSITSDRTLLVDQLTKHKFSARMLQPETVAGPDNQNLYSHVFSIELWGNAPEYLYQKEQIPEWEQNEDENQNCQNILDGISSLNKVPDVSALPSKIEGHVRFIYEDNNQKVNFAFASVELFGTASPNTNIEDSCINPIAITDEDGNFVLDMPDNYNFCGKVVFRFSKNNSTHDVSYDTSDLLEKINDERLEFTLSSETLRLIRDDNRGALPSVKLMGDGNRAVHLNTDTLPSRVFKYSFIQRLLAPTVTRRKSRHMLENPIDVDLFKEGFKNPDRMLYPNSLGIGYMLNMHQAWAPDGFSLGSMLYSTILAPGEEQRLVVRERKEELRVTDTMTGSDNISDTSDVSQKDNARAIFDEAANRSSNAGSDYHMSSKSESTGFSWGFPFFGLGAMSHANSSQSAKGGASSYQKDMYNEASTAAQEFQYRIKSSSERNVVANRMSIHAATSSEADSVATKIIANHNHSHVMTIQYWEIMRRYRLETCIESVNLVLFIPMKLINFAQTMVNGVKSASEFKMKYSALNKYYDILRKYIPRERRSALELVNKYSSKNEFKISESEDRISSLTISMSATFLPYDNVSVRLILRDGTVVTGVPQNEYRQSVPTTPQSHKDLRMLLQNMRNNISYNRTCLWFFALPGVLSTDIMNVEVVHSFDSSYSYGLVLDYSALTDNQKEAYKNYMSKEEDFAEDDKSSGKDKRRMSHYEELLPEAFTSPRGVLTQNDMRQLGYPEITSMYISSVKSSDDNRKPVVNESFTINMYTNTLRDVLRASVSYDRGSMLTKVEMEKIESLYNHVVNNTVYYSQCVWRSLSTDELILMLEQYTIDMPLDRMDEDKRNGGNYRQSITNVPLLNCVDVYRPIGFYGSCLLLPFVIPEELAEKFEKMQKNGDITFKSSKDLQDRLYKYHVRNFRVPTTTISLPTSGMVGEAVLGETNVSELIDLTRFWNWKDAEIDHMDITKDYLNSNSLVEKAATKDITMPTVGASLPKHEALDILSKLISKPAPQWNDLSDNVDIKAQLQDLVDKTASGRDKVLDVNSGMINKVMETLGKIVETAAGVLVKDALDKKKEKDKDKDGKGKDGDAKDGKGGDGKGAGANGAADAGGAGGGAAGKADGKSA